MGSVGNKLIIPLVSTFDPSGIVAAKAGLKELSQTKIASSGGGGAGAASGGDSSTRSSHADDADRIFEKTRTASEKYEYQVRKLDDLHKRGAISTETYHRAQKQAADELPKSPGLGSRIAGGVQGAAGMVGGPVADIANLAFSSSAGGAVAAVGAVAIWQKLAGGARELRMESQKLGTSTTYYQSLGAAARSAGHSMDLLVGGIENLQGRSKGALSGDRAQQSFFASIGLSREDLERGMDDTDYLAKKVAGRGLTAGQKVQAFGSAAAADAIRNASGGSSVAMSAAQRQALADTHFDAESAKSGALKAAGMVAEAFKGIGMLIGDRLGGGNRSGADIQKDMDREAAGNERAEREGKVEAHRRDQAAALSASLAAPDVQAEQDRLDRLPFEQYMTGRDVDRAETQTRKRLYAAQAPDNRWEENLDNAQNVSRREHDEGTIDDRRYAQRRVNLRAEAAAQAAPTLSNAANIQEQIGIAAQQYQAIASSSSRSPAERDRETTANDRSLVDKLTDYAESITRSGNLAGAYDANSVGGYSQQVSAEYGMAQSQDSLKMVEMLIKIAENTGRMSNEQGEAVLGQLGFRTKDIFGAAGGD